MPDPFETLPSKSTPASASGEATPARQPRKKMTPEATLAVVDRLAPGFVEAMRAASLAITPHAMLSRAVAGARHWVVPVSAEPDAAFASRLDARLSELLDG